MEILKNHIKYRPNGRTGITGLFNNSLEIEIYANNVADKLEDAIDINNMSLYDWRKISSLRYPNFDDKKFDRTKDIFSNIDKDIKEDYSLELLDDLIYYSFHTRPDRTGMGYGTIHKKYGKPIEINSNIDKEYKDPNYIYLLQDGYYVIDDGFFTMFFSIGSNKELVSLLEKKYNVGADDKEIALLDYTNY